VDKQTISFDLDDTLFECTKAFVRYLNRRKNFHIDYNKIRSPERALPHLSDHEELMLWKEFFYSTDGLSYKPTKQVRTLVKKLHQNYRLIIISSRDFILQKVATIWVRKHFGNTFDKILFVKNEHSKVEKSVILLKEKAVLHLDDKLKHIRDCHVHQIPSILVAAPWNQKVNAPAPRMSNMSYSLVKKMIASNII
jgi:hypothetical protein